MKPAPDESSRLKVRIIGQVRESKVRRPMKTSSVM
jgi:hypothetical protein